MIDNIKPKKSLGQNFLKNKYTINTIVDILELQKDECILEIGPGQGALTEFLIKKTKNYIGIEKDKNLCVLLEKKFPNINIINEDILAVDFNSFFNKKIRIIGNIPYNISTKLLLKCLEKRDNIKRIDFMMQKEFVERIISEHGNKSYGRLSVLIQLFFKAEKYIDISPAHFFPEPKIYSSFKGFCAPLGYIQVEARFMSFFTLASRAPIITFRPITILESKNATGSSMFAEMPPTLPAQ